MIGRVAPLLFAAAVLSTAAAPRVRAQAPPDVQLLDVPYLPQTEALCGGAAVAMLMRYWGATGVYAETFASLVDPKAGGIRGDALIGALRSRGWSATSVRGTEALVQAELRARRPVIVLIEDRPNRYHYVVVVGWANGRVVIHDPARAPFRVVTDVRFAEAWKPTSHWTLIASPDANASAAPPAAPTDGTADAGHDDRACGGLVEEGVRAAGLGDAAGARRRFELAMSTCPASPAAWREMAGLYALDRQWPDAARLARQALARDPHDQQASSILATALYLQNDERGALAAWNAVGEPRVDLVNITGLERTRFAIAAAAIGVSPGALLTPASLDRAARRLNELPSAQSAHVAYTPLAGGQARLDAVVLERPVAPTAPVTLAAAAARAATDREITATIASPTGGGEAWQASWRWWANRPRASLRFDAPAPFGGTWGIELARERQTYQAGAFRIEERQTSARFRTSDWTRSGMRWELTAAVESWQNRGGGLAVGGGIDKRLVRDRLALRGQGSLWTASRDAWTATLETRWRSSTAREGTEWIARGGVAAAGASAPLAWWPGAGTGQGRDVLLRAHPLLDDGVVRDGVFGRTLVYSGLEWRGWRSTGKWLLRIAPAAFVDAARATHALEGDDRTWQVDAGGGVRIALPGSEVLRVDLAHGLRDGAFVLSAGWVHGWS